MTLTGGDVGTWPWPRPRLDDEYANDEWDLAASAIPAVVPATWRSMLQSRLVVHLVVLDATETDAARVLSAHASEDDAGAALAASGAAGCVQAVEVT